MQLSNRPFRLCWNSGLWTLWFLVSLFFTLVLHRPAFAEAHQVEPIAPTAAISATVIFVDLNAPGPGHDGQSWTTAYTTVQDALAAAGGGEEIWVAAGIYYPDEGAGATNNSQLSSFALKNDVALYGGFVGGEANREERDWLTNHTVLSGDLSQNDPNKNSDGISATPSTMVTPNAYQVVTASNIASGASWMVYCHRWVGHGLHIPLRSWLWRWHLP
ncbi:MAG: hypothetical protein R2932_07345 [Caldilineaceae bacterium]